MGGRVHQETRQEGGVGGRGGGRCRVGLLVRMWLRRLGSSWRYALALLSLSRRRTAATPAPVVHVRASPFAAAARDGFLRASAAAGRRALNAPPATVTAVTERCPCVGTRVGPRGGAPGPRAPAAGLRGPAAAREESRGCAGCQRPPRGRGGQVSGGGWTGGGPVGRLRARAAAPPAGGGGGGGGARPSCPLAAQHRRRGAAGDW